MLPGRFRLAALGAATLLALAACGGSTPSGVATLRTDAPGAGPSGSPAASMDPETAQLEFAKCMREHGVDVPDPGPNGGGVFAVGGSGAEVEKFQEANEACSHFLEAAFGPPPTPDPAMLDRMVDFAQCMREHGVDFPDPQAQGGGVSIQVGPGGVDPGSDQFQEAQEACQPILGGDGPVFGVGTDGGPGPGTDPGPGVRVGPVEPAGTPNP